MNFQTWLSIVSIIVGSGAIGYVIRLLIRIAVLEDRFESTKTEVERLCRVQEVNIVRMTLIDSSLSDLKEVSNISYDNNRKLVEITTTLMQITDIIKVIVPRAEIEYHWRAYDQAVQDIKNLSNKLSDKLDALKALK